MGNIAPRLASLVFIQFLLVKIVTSQCQPSVAQYLQLAGLGPHSSHTPSPPHGPPSYSNYGTPASYQPSSSQYPPNYPSKPSQSLPSPSLPMPLSAIANLAASIPVPSPSTPQKPPTVPKSSESLPTPGLDSNVLNNLAIALQLLIVSNILNMPSAENTPSSLSTLELPYESITKHKSVPISPLAVPYPVQSSVSLQSSNPYLESLYSVKSSVPVQSGPYLESPIPQSQYSLSSVYESQSLPNSNFLGSSGFMEPAIFRSTMTPVRPSPRSSMTLMSPYEALGPNSPFSDPVLSSVYSPSYSKKDFKSPYASILAADGNRDLFSMTDLF